MDKLVSDLIQAFVEIDRRLNELERRAGAARLGSNARRAPERDGAVNNWSDEQTDEPLFADDRNFYKVEAWSREGMRIDALLYAGSNLDKAREIFVTTIKHRPGLRLTIRLFVPTS